METTDSANISNIIITSINNIFQTLFSSIDNSLYRLLDDIVFIDEKILSNGYLNTFLGTSASKGIIIVANSLILAFLLYFTIRYMLSHITYTEIETPYQFIFKLIILSICMNFSYFLVERFLNINSTITLTLKSIGENILNKSISFSSLINEVNSTVTINSTNLNVFSVDGLIRSTLSFSLLSLIISYSLRYIMVKVLVLLTPFAILSFSLKSTSWFFKSWLKTLFSLLFIQIIVELILIILFSIDFSSGNLLNKFLYIGGIYLLLRANNFVKEFIGGVSTTVSQSVANWR